MIRIPRWLFFALLPVLFIGGGAASIRPVWRCLERAWIRPVPEAERSYFPVLVRDANGTFAPAPLGDIPSGSMVATAGFDVSAINRDLNARIGSNADYPFFTLRERTPDVTSVTFEVPTTRNLKVQSWYDVRGTEVIPRKIMSYGPGLAFFILPLSTGCGIMTALVFASFVRPRKSGRDAEGG